MKMKASAVVGKGEQTLLCDLGFELRLTWGKEKKNCEDNKTRDEQQNKIVRMRQWA